MDKVIAVVGIFAKMDSASDNVPKFVTAVIGSGIALVAVATAGLAFYAGIPLGVGAVVVIFALTVMNVRSRRRAASVLLSELPPEISVERIGMIERDLENLQCVMVIADKVEAPISVLRDAVEHNFARGVKYLFLVSRDRVRDEVAGYYKLFEALAQIVIKRGLPDGPKVIRDLVEIEELPYNWDDYPYIFYRVRAPSGEIRTLAFRGDRLHKGITEHYSRVDPTYAHTIARAIISEAPKSICCLEIDRDQFETETGVEFSRPGSIQSKTIQ